MIEIRRMIKVNLTILAVTAALLLGFVFDVSDANASPGSVTVTGNVNYCYTLIAVGVESWYRCGNVTYQWPGMPEGNWDLIIDQGSVPGWRFVSVSPGGQQSNVNNSFSWYSTWEPLPPPVPSVAISASPTTVNYGGQTTVSWSVSPSGDSRISCTAGGSDPNWQGNIGNTGYSSTSQSLFSSQTYSVTCSSSSGSNSASVTVNVNPPPQVSVNLSASPTSVAYNGTTTLSWSSSNASSCTAGGTHPSWQGSIATSGSSTSPSLTSSQTYTVTCSNPYNSDSKSVFVSVGSPPVVETRIRANGSDNPITVAYNSVVTIDWGSNNASSCTATGDYPSWQGSIPGSGASNTSPMTESHTFGMTCTGPGGSSSDSILVNVGAPPAVSVSLSGSPTTVSYNGTTTLTWSSSNASSCTAGGTHPSWQGSIALSGSSTSPSLTSSQTYTVTCSGPGGSDSKNVVVNVIPNYTLNVTKSGTGSGTVTGSGINCGSDCDETYNSGSYIEYFHSEDPGSTWGGWSGACTGPGCIICFDSNKALTATFTKKTPTVSITCSPGTVSYNSSANVSWSSKNTSNCTVSPTGWTGKSGSQSTGNLTSSQTYFVTCAGE